MIDYTNPNERAVIEAMIRDEKTRPARRMELMERLHRLTREAEAKLGNHAERLKGA